MMDARHLLAWGDLEARRRRGAGVGWTRLSPWLYSVLAGVVLVFVTGRAMRVFGDAVAGDSDPGGAANLWLAVLTASHVIVLLGAPFRMYWRHDAALIGRTAIPGKSIFTVAWIRNTRAAAKVSLPCAASALMFALGPFGVWEVALRHLVLVAIAFLWAGFMGPVIALVAGAVVASDRARAALSSLAGEFQPPKTSWLGVLPGLAGTGLVLVLIGCVSWSRGGVSSPVGEPLYLIGLSVVVPVAALAWAMARADAIMVNALREVSALDQERLAHIDLTKPSAVERLVARMLSGKGARAVLEKDATLAKRRFPIPFFLGVLGVLVSWIMAAVGADDLMLWAGTICACLGVYGVIMARRYMLPPIEYLDYIRTLPIASRDLRRAKRAHLALWILAYMLLGAVPVIARAPAPGVTAAVLGGIMLATWLAGVLVTRDV